MLAWLCHIKLLSSRRVLVHACSFSCNLPPALLAEWPGSFTCYCGNTWWNGYRNKSQHRRLNPEKNISRLSCRDSNSRHFIHESGALTTELFPLLVTGHLRLWQNDRDLLHAIVLLMDMDHYMRRTSELYWENTWLWDDLERIWACPEDLDTVLR